MKDKKVHIVKDIISYGIGSNLSDVIGFFIATLVRRFLGPFYMGIWSLLRVILSYASYTDLGITNIIYFKIPLYVGKNDKGEIDSIHNTVFSFLWVTNIVSGIVILIGSLLFKSKLPHELFIGLLVLPLIMLIQRFYAMYIALIRAHKKFSVLGTSYLFDSILNLLLIILFLRTFKIYGIYIVSVILPLLDIAYVRFFTDFKFKFQLVWIKLKGYLSFAFPVFISNLLDTLFFSIDRLMTAGMLGMVSLGYYSVAIMCKNSAVNFTRSFASVFSPYFIEDYGKTNDISRVLGYVFKYTEVLSYLMMILLGFIYLVFPIFIRLAMPKFDTGISATQITIFGIYFAVLSGQFRNLLMVNNKQRYIICATLAASAVCLSANYFLIKAGMGIDGVAIGSSLAAAVLFFTYIYRASLYGNPGAFIRFLSVAVAPFIFFIGIFFAIDHLTAFSSGLKFSLKAVFFICVSSGLSLYINKKVRLVGIFKEIFKKGKK